MRRATAHAEIPSLRPSNPIPSVVLPFRLTRSSGRENIPAIDARRAGATGAIFGSSQTMTASRPTSPNPLSTILPRAWAMMLRPGIPFVSSASGGKCRPMSGSPSAP